MIIRYTDPVIDALFAPVDILLPRLDNTLHVWMARHIETCLHARLGRTVYVTL